MLEVPDNIDNDCDGTTDEETCGNGKDDDEDGLVDEDCKDYSVPPTQRDATGTSFAITFMSNIVRDLPAGYVDQVELYIAPLEPGTLVSVTSPLFNGEGHPTYNDVPASPGSVLQLAINPNMRQTPVNSVRLGKSTITNKGIKLVANKPVVVYGINKKQFSTDGFLALPINVLGSEYYAYCNSPVVIEDDRCQFAVVGVKNGTRINMVVQNGVTLDGIDNGQPIVGPTTHSVILDAYQVLEVQSVDDITGTRVYSDDDIHFSFFSGNIRTRVPSDKGSRDHLVEQLPSTDTWGNSFSTMAMPREADEGDLFKILAKDTNTEIIFSYFDDVQSLATEVFTLQPGEYHQIFMNNSSPVNIESDKPVLVIQITKSAPPNYLFNDPAAIVVIPESRWSREYRFVTPLSGKRQGNYQVSFNNYIVLAIRKEYREGLFIVDTEGREIDIGTRNDWVEMPGNPEIEGLVFRLPQGQTFISNLSPEATWMALLYGKANRETYGNAIGLNFFSSDITCTNVRMVSGDGIDNDCDGKIDEEMSNGVDDDGDGKVDEDLGLPPMGYTYIFTFEENLVEYPRNYALEIYVGAQSEVKSTCRMETPGKRYAPSYDVTTVVHEPLARADRIQFAVSAALRTMGTGVQRTSILVTCDQPVTLMGINKETFSADAFVVMEQSKLGMDYYTVSYSPATIQTQFAVVAVMNGTTNVIIAPKAPITWDDNEVQDVNVDLHRYEVFQAQSKDDLTGSRITANKPVAVFSGNIRTKVELSASRDHLASQLLPTTSWGTRFNLVPTWFRTVGDIFRVVAKDDNTRISWNGDARTLARAGDHTELKLRSTRAYSLTATRPIMVMQLIKSQASAYNSEPADPCWHAVAPVELYTNKSTVVTPLYSRGFYKDGEHFKNYLTIIVPEQFQNDIRINGVSVNSNPDVRYANTNERRIIRGSDYVAVDIILQKEGIGTYEIINVNPGVKFSGYLVGVADRESYCVLIGN
ncbi:uncharacterized protein [Watersipora subatra]|uniref:uncharacterized protein n=1 Tax=Watersipora subatra TaxID=2589382 RepID=UPI00355C9139